MKINVERNKWNRPSNEVKSVNSYCGHKKNEKEINSRLSLCDKYSQENDIIKLKKILDELIELGKKIKDEKMEKENHKFLQNKGEFVEKVVDFDGELI